MTLQGLLASFTDGSSTGQVYAGAALVELVARLTSGIVFAKLFDVGLGLPSWAAGFPFFVAAVCCATAPGHRRIEAEPYCRGFTC